HEPAPSFLQTPRGSATPRSTGQQVPSRPTCVHETHPPWHATLQHTPSAQKPEAHSVAFAQKAPRGFFPQLPPTHLMPVAQSASLAQVARHLLADESQPNGAHTVAGPGLQWPPVSQTKTWSTTAPSHVPGWHTVPGAYRRHAPAPLHVPS